MIETNGIKAWLLAARPKTLTGALAPVIVGLSAAWAQRGSLDWWPAILCALFALLMQVDANLLNDYLDFHDGIDKEDRLGPERACQQGWITPRAMRLGIGLVTLVACLTGLPLVWWGGWWMVAIGAACVIGCALYSTLARLALGDILVVAFFGIVPVCATYYLQDNSQFIIHNAQFSIHNSQFIIHNAQSSIHNSQLWGAALAMGLVTDCLLLVNNYRDRDTDLRVGKRTIPNIIGPNATLMLYAIIGIVAVCLVYNQTRLPILYLPLNFFLVHRLHTIRQGRQLNQVLGQTAMSILLFALLYSVGVVIGF